MGITWLYVIGLGIAGLIVWKFVPTDKKPATH